MADLNGVDEGLKERVFALLAASHGRINIQSGFRTNAQQADLYRREPNLAAPPGHSNHEKGLAVDLGGDYALIKQLAPQFGLSLPMSWEPWHVEMPSTRDGSKPTAYTNSPYGDQNPTMDTTIAQRPESILATAVDAMRTLSGSQNPLGEQKGPVGEQTGPLLADGTTQTSTGGTSGGGGGSGGSGGGSATALAPYNPSDPAGSGNDKRVPGHSIEGWAKDVLTGLGAPITDQNMQAMITWANTESGGYNPGVAGGRFNPLNTTEGALGFAGNGGSQGNIKDYASYEQGVQNQVHNLLHTRGAGYEPIVAALRAGNDPQAVFHAVNGSAFGTHF